MSYSHFPKQQGLYYPQFEKDSCGVGFVCQVKGQRSNKIIKQSLKVLRRLAHRGAVGSDPKTGDGAGILIQIPDEFFQKISSQIKVNLPPQGSYGTGLIFLPTDRGQRKICQELFSQVIKDEGQILLGWRDVPVDNSDIGLTAKETEPVIGQVFIGKNPKITDQLAFERKLYVIRRIIENTIPGLKLKQESFFYITSLSSRTFAYKGLLMTDQLENFFPDLKDENIKSCLALVHSRYSTNTFPTWDLSQPFRFLAHNGEINTLRGNINWMHAREGLLESSLFGSDIEKLKPILIDGLSDSATIDRAFELLTLGGRSIAQAMMMLIPAAWESNALLDKKLIDFYKYHACFMEPWDGPAAIAFTDGESIGAVLDRNGLRPARYIVTKTDTVVMASEVGVLDIKPQDIAHSGRLEPGKMFYIDTKKGQIVSDQEIKDSVSTAKDYGAWLKKNLVDLDQLKAKKAKPEEKESLLTLMKVFGYSREDLRMVIGPMAQKGIEPTGSMGNDTPLAILSSQPQNLYNYFKQLFAQVTNPAIDPIREECVMSLISFVGKQENILGESAQHCHKLLVNEPILSDQDLGKIASINQKGFKTKTISLLFDLNSEGAFLKALDNVCFQAEEAIKDNYSFIILTDRGVSKTKAALPILLATGAVHHYLVGKSMRTQIGIIVESAEPRQVHHFALLFGYGADCINPYLAYQAINCLVQDKILDLDFKTARKNYRKALDKGIKKILSKMGISTLQSYRGAQIFEALGLSQEVVNKCFRGTVSRIGGVDFEVIQKETTLRHVKAFDEVKINVPYLSSGGLYQWRKDGEFHLWNPESVASLQDAAKKNDYQIYKKFANLINDQSDNPTTLRSLLKFKKTESIPIDQVEPAQEIFKRFATGAMSFGSISAGAHETLALAMNRLGGRSNTGEGGEDPARFRTLPNGDSRRSAIKQVASGRFGVTANYLTNADELQIKIAQGAKPGEGGQLPGHKVSVTIAKTRYTTPGVTLISPPPHHDIYSIEDLAQLIFDLKNTNPRARISVKLVSEIGVGTIAAGVAKGHADMILISGGDGGTGASPVSSIYHAGLPWELGLSETHQTLVLNDLRSRVRLQADGQMRTGRDVAIAAILGAEEYGFCTAALIVMGCVMLRHCHLNNCSVGVATQDEILEGRFRGKVDEVVNYFRFVVSELREIMAQLGIGKIDQLVGRTDLLEVNQDIIPWKARGIDYSKILYQPKVGKEIGIYRQKSQDHGLDQVLDRQLIKLAQPALLERKEVEAELEIKNINRTTGAMLSGEVARAYGDAGLPEDTIKIKFKGVAGQSFGAWLARGLTFELEGIANDYVGKGISGGKIIIQPPKSATYKPQENITIGNTTFYGAVKGEAYIRGLAGERFCIRNSGLNAVVEGVGDHGCEYMTGGRVIILGRTGRNFAAGMSGGIAYVYDQDKMFKDKCNLSMVELEEPGKEDKETIYNLLHNHYSYTKSEAAKEVLDDFEANLKKFVKVMPIEYKRILSEIEIEEKLGLTEASDG
jgi:glutamate synthase domain-containing protein 2/glutamate synthase domain-containing protein 1/glutamate synthase domain-containing protein 3